MTNQLDACKELIRPIVEDFEKSHGLSKSRVILLSGSPIDKKTQIPHFFRLLSIMTSDRLAVNNPQTFTLIWRGIQEIEDYCATHFSRSDVMMARQLYTSAPHYGRNRDTGLNDYCYLLFQQFVKKYCSNSMDPISVKTQIIKQNAFYQLGNPTDVNLLDKGIAMLSRATHFNPQEQTVDFGHDGIASLRAITRALIMIETAKINLFARVARATLTNDPQRKVVICVNYKETIDDLINLLADFHPLRLDGGVSQNNREEILRKFQKPDTEYRLLIGNLIVCSTGIDLDDKAGQFPRTCLVNPNYSTITLYQLSHRFYRINTKSDAMIHFVLCKENTELAMLNALAIKSSIMKEITTTQSEHGIIFPGDYQRWDEP
jgi:SNF2 family DNA or RNA helicase